MEDNFPGMYKALGFSATLTTPTPAKHSKEKRILSKEFSRNSWKYAEELMWNAFDQKGTGRIEVQVSRRETQVTSPSFRTCVQH